MTGKSEVFLDRLEVLRAGRSVSAFARFVGINQKTLDCIVKGEHRPSVPVIVALCQACHCSADWLLGLAEKDAGAPEIAGPDGAVSQQDVVNVRNSLGMTQEEMADAIGITRQYLALIETGKREPSARVLGACQELVDKMSRPPLPTSPDQGVMMRLDAIQTDLQIIKKLLIRRPEQ